MNAKDTNCLIWGTPAKGISSHDYGNQVIIDSPRAGGKYQISGTAQAMLTGFNDSDRVKITNHVVDQNRLGNAPAQLDSTVIKRIRNDRVLSVNERRDRLLTFLARRVSRIDECVKLSGVVNEELLQNQTDILAWTGSIEHREYWFLIKFAEKEGLIESVKEGVRLTPKGYAYLADLDAGNPGSSQAFVAMWFNERMNQPYEEGIAKAIRDAGYIPLRIDRKEHTNKIDDEIIAEIRRSRFIVADFTSEPEKPRGGVYFETGFALGLSIPVIWTCRKDSIDQVHFDTRQFNHIVWVTPEELYTKLVNRIGAVIGDGPLKSAE